MYIAILLLLILILTGQCYTLGKRRGANKYSELVIDLLKTDNRLLQNTLQDKWQKKELPVGFFRSTLHGIKECYNPRQS